MDCTLINIKQMKHTYSKNDQLCQAAIYPAVLKELSSKITPSMKQKQKLVVIEEILSQFKPMLKTFVSSQDDELNVIYLIALHCSKAVEMNDCFHLIIQLLH